jgi:predicted transcriptional regulator
MEERVLSSTYRELSLKDVAFLEAMLPDARESRMARIADRMGVSTGYAAKYKNRLLSLGVIRELSRGLVDFDLPGMRSYVAKRRQERG